MADRLAPGEEPPCAPAAGTEQDASPDIAAALAGLDLDVAAAAAVAAAAGDAAQGPEGESAADAADDDAGGVAPEQLPEERRAAVFAGPEWNAPPPAMYDYETEYRGADGQLDDDEHKAVLRGKVTNIPARLFKLRGPDYLHEDKLNNIALKQSSGTAAYACVALKVFQSSSNLAHGAQKIGPLKDYLAKLAAFDAQHGTPGGDAPMYLIASWTFSNFFKTEYTSVVHVLRRTMKIDSSETGDDPALDRAFSRWLALSNEQKNNKLKYACIVRESNEQLKSAISMLGGERPVLIGKRLTTSYFRGDNYLEVNMDVGSSNVASMLNGLVLKTSGKLVIDECWCIEGQAADELPERALCAVRWNNCSIEDCRQLLNRDGSLAASK